MNETMKKLKEMANAGDPRRTLEVMIENHITTQISVPERTERTLARGYFVIKALR